MSYPCPECHRNFGDGESCEHCEFTPAPASVSSQLAAVQAARQALAEARKKKENADG